MLETVLQETGTFAIGHYFYERSTHYFFAQEVPPYYFDREGKTHIMVISLMDITQSAQYNLTS